MQRCKYLFLASSALLAAGLNVYEANATYTLTTDELNQIAQDYYNKGHTDNNGNILISGDHIVSFSTGYDDNLDGWITPATDGEGTAQVANGGTLANVYALGTNAKRLKNIVSGGGLQVTYPAGLVNIEGVDQSYMISSVDMSFVNTGYAYLNNSANPASERFIRVDNGIQNNTSNIGIRHWGPISFSTTPNYGSLVNPIDSILINTDGTCTTTLKFDNTDVYVDYLIFEDAGNTTNTIYVGKKFYTGIEGDNLKFSTPGIIRTSQNAADIKLYTGAISTVNGQGSFEFASDANFETLSDIGTATNHLAELKFDGDHTVTLNANGNNIYAPITTAVNGEGILSLTSNAIFHDDIGTSANKLNEIHLNDIDQSFANAVHVENLRLTATAPRAITFTEQLNAGALTFDAASTSTSTLNLNAASATHNLGGVDANSNTAIINVNEDTNITSSANDSNLTYNVADDVTLTHQAQSGAYFYADVNFAGANSVMNIGLNRSSDINGNFLGGTGKLNVTMSQDYTAGNIDYGMVGKIDVKNFNFTHNEVGDAGGLYLHGSVKAEQFNYNSNHADTFIYLHGNEAIDIAGLSFTNLGDHIQIHNDGGVAQASRRLSGAWNAETKFYDDASFTVYGDLVFSNTVSNNTQASSINLDNNSAAASLTFSAGLTGQKFNVTRDSAGNDSTLNINGAYNYTLGNIGTNEDNLTSLNINATSLTVDSVYTDNLTFNNGAALTLNAASSLGAIDGNGNTVTINVNADTDITSSASSSNITYNVADNITLSHAAQTGNFFAGIVDLAGEGSTVQIGLNRGSDPITVITGGVGNLIITMADTNTSTSNDYGYVGSVDVNRFEFIHNDPVAAGGLYLHGQMKVNEFDYTSDHASSYVQIPGNSLFDIGSVTFTGGDNVRIYNGSSKGPEDRMLTGTWTPPVLFVDQADFTAYGNLTFEKLVTNNDASGNAYSTINLNNTTADAHLIFSGGLAGTKEFNITRSSPANEANLTLSGAYAYSLHNIGANLANITNLNLDATSLTANSVYTANLTFNSGTTLTLNAASNLGAVDVNSNTSTIKLGDNTTITSLANDANLTVEFTGTETLTLNGSSAADFAFKANNGVISVADGVNLSGAISTTANNIGNLTFVGGSSVTGAAGASGNALNTITAGAGNVSFTNAVYVQDIVFNGANQITTPAGSAISNDVAFAANAGTYTQNGGTIGGAINRTAATNTTVNLTGVTVTGAVDAATITLNGATLSSTLDVTTLNIASGSSSVAGVITATNINYTAAGSLAAGSDISSAINFAGNNGAVSVADGANLSGVVSTTTNNTGNLTFLGSSNVTGAVGANGNALNTITAGATGKAVNFSQVIYAQNINFSGSGTISVADGVNAAINFFGNNGKISVADGANLSGVISNTANNTGNLTFLGSSNVTGAVGAGGNALNAITAGAGNVSFSNAVYVQDIVFNGTNQITIPAGSAIANDVAFAANAGTYTQNGGTIGGAITRTAATNTTVNLADVTVTGAVDVATLNISGISSVAGEITADDIIFTGNGGLTASSNVTGNIDFNNKTATYTQSSGTLSGNISRTGTEATQVDLTNVIVDGAVNSKIVGLVGSTLSSTLDATTLNIASGNSQIDGAITATNINYTAAGQLTANADVTAAIDFGNFAGTYSQTAGTLTGSIARDNNTVNSTVNLTGVAVTGAVDTATLNIDGISSVAGEITADDIIFTGNGGLTASTNVTGNIDFNNKTATYTQSSGLLSGNIIRTGTEATQVDLTNVTVGGAVNSAIVGLVGSTLSSTLDATTLNIGSGNSQIDGAITATNINYTAAGQLTANADVTAVIDFAGNAGTFIHNAGAFTGDLGSSVAQTGIVTLNSNAVINNITNNGLSQLDLAATGGVVEFAAAANNLSDIATINFIGNGEVIFNSTPDQAVHIDANSPTLTFANNVSLPVITTHATGNGNINLLGNNGLTGNLGADALRFASVGLGTGNYELSAGKNIYANQIKLLASDTVLAVKETPESDLIFEHATAQINVDDNVNITQAIDAAAADQGVLVFAGNSEVSAAIGANNKLKEIQLGANGSKVKFNQPVRVSNNTIIFSGDSELETVSSIEGNINFKNFDGTLRLLDNALINDRIYNEQSGKGRVILDGNSKIIADIGVSNSPIKYIEAASGSSEITSNLYAEALNLTSDNAELKLSKQPNAAIDFSANAKLTIEGELAKSLTANGGKGNLVLGTGQVTQQINADVNNITFTANNLNVNADILKAKEILFVDKSVLNFQKDVNLDGKVTFNNNQINLASHKVSLDEGVLAGVNEITTELDYQGQGNFNMGHFETKTGQLSLAPGEDKFIINLKQTNAAIHEGDNFIFIKNNATKEDENAIIVQSPGILSKFSAYVNEDDLVFTASLNDVSYLLNPVVKQDVNISANIKNLDKILKEEKYRDNEFLVALNNADYNNFQALVEQVLGDEKELDVADAATAINTASDDASHRIVTSVMMDNLANNIAAGERMKFTPGLWAEYKRGDAKQSRNKNAVHSFKSFVDSVTLGADIQFENNNLVGLAATLVNSKSKYQAIFNKGFAKTESKILTGYGLKYLPYSLFSANSLSLGINHRREQSLINGKVNKKVSDFIAFNSRFGRKYSYNIIDLMPYLYYSFSHINMHAQKKERNSFKTVQGFNINNHQLGGGINLAMNILHGETLFRPFANIEYKKSLNVKPVKYKFNIIGIDEDYQQVYKPNDNMKLSTSFGMEISSEKYSVNAKYSTSYANKFKEHSGSINLKVKL